MGPPSCTPSVTLCHLPGAAVTATGQGSVARAADRLARVTVRRPRPHEVPDWGPETIRLLAALTALERSFVEWFATGMNAAEAYRMAAGREAGPGPDAARQLGYKIRARPRVRLAIDAALRDGGSGARVDREWLLMKLTQVVEVCEGSDRKG